MKQHLVVFARFAEANWAKTRLIPLFGPEGVARLQHDMTRHTLAIAREASSDYPNICRSLF